MATPSPATAVASASLLLSGRPRCGPARPPARGRGPHRWPAPAGGGARRTRPRSSADAQPSVTNALRKTPPLSVTRSRPVRRRTSGAAATTTSTTPCWKRAATRPRRGTRPHVARDGEHHRCRLPHERSGPGPEPEAVALDVAGTAGDRLQLHGRLGVVPRAVADAGQRRHRVEEPAHARRGHAGEPALELPLEEAGLAGPARPHAGQVVGPLHARRAAGGRAPSGRGCGPRRRRPGGRRTQGERRAGSRRTTRPAPRRPRRHRRRRTRCRRRRPRSPARRSGRRARPSSRRRGHGGAAPRGPAGRRRARPPSAAERYAGWRSAASASGRTPVSSSRWVSAAVNARSVATSSMSPTWADIQASRPSARQNVFFRSAPTASTGGTSNGSVRGSGASPRDRRTGASTPATTRVTESSQGTWIGRSCSSHASARPASRARASSSSVTMGSPATLPLVITSARGPSRVTGQTQEQMVERRGGQHQAEVVLAGRDRGRER